MLIIGGLAAIALLALIGLFLVLRGGSRSAKPAAPQEADKAGMEQALPAVAPAEAASGHNGFAPPPASTVGDDWTLALANPELRARLRGQVRELKYELYYLHQRSREINQRATLLAGIIARVQELTGDNAMRMQPQPHTPSQSQPQPPGSVSQRVPAMNAHDRSQQH